MHYYSGTSFIQTPWDRDVFTILDFPDLLVVNHSYSYIFNQAHVSRWPVCPGFLKSLWFTLRYVRICLSACVSALEATNN